MHRVHLVRNFNRVRVRVSQDQVYVNSKPMEDDRLVAQLTHLMRRYENDFLIVFEPDEGISYGRYVRYLDLFLTTIDLLRADRFYAATGKNPSDLTKESDYQTLDSVNTTYPGYIVEWTHEERRLLKIMERLAQ